MRTITQEEFRAAIETIRVYKEQLESKLKESKQELSDIPPSIHYTPDTYIDDVNMSIRLYHALRMFFGRGLNDLKLKDLDGVRITSIAKRGVGDVTILELQEICKYTSVGLIDDRYKGKEERKKYYFSKPDISTCTPNTPILDTGMIRKYCDILINYLIKTRLVDKETNPENIKVSNLEGISLRQFLKEPEVGVVFVNNVKDLLNHLNIPYIE